jgi:hypothetical protein
MSLPVASAHIDFRATRARQLNADMARSAEAIETKPSTVPVLMSQSGQSQTAVTDDTGAQ